MYAVSACWINVRGDEAIGNFKNSSFWQILYLKRILGMNGEANVIDCLPLSQIPSVPGTSLP